MISIIMASRIEGNENWQLPSFFESIDRNTVDVSNVEVFIYFDNDDPLVQERIPPMNLDKKPYKVQYITGPRGRGYIDLHLKYNDLLPLTNPKTDIIAAMADDFEVNYSEWDKAVNECAAEYSHGLFFIHGRSHPSGHRPDLFTKRFNLDWPLEWESMTGIDEAPMWSRKLIETCGGFYHSFTDAWTISLEHLLYHKYGLCMTAFPIPKPNERDRHGCLILRKCHRYIDSPDNTFRWHVQRKQNFDEMLSGEYHRKLEIQGQKIVNYLANWSQRV